MDNESLTAEWPVDYFTKSRLLLHLRGFPALWSAPNKQGQRQDWDSVSLTGHSHGHRRTERQSTNKATARVSLRFVLFGVVTQINTPPTLTTPRPRQMAVTCVCLCSLIRKQHDERALLSSTEKLQKEQQQTRGKQARFYQAVFPKITPQSFYLFPLSPPSLWNQTSTHFMPPQPYPPPTPRQTKHVY